MKAVLALSLVATLCLSSSVADDKCDKKIDMILAGFKKQFIQKGQDVIKIPDIDYHVTVPVWKFTVSGDVHFHDGSFKNTTSIARTHTCDMYMEGEDLLVTKASLGFQDLSLHFGDYLIKLLGISSSGAFTASVGSNEITTQLTVNITDLSCTLDTFDLTSLGDYKLSFEPSGIFNNLKSKIFTSILNDFSGKIKDAVGSALSQFAQSAFKEISSTVCGQI